MVIRANAIAIASARPRAVAVAFATITLVSVGVGVGCAPAERCDRDASCASGFVCLEGVCLEHGAELIVSDDRLDDVVRSGIADALIDNTRVVDGAAVGTTQDEIAPIDEGDDLEGGEGLDDDVVAGSPVFRCESGVCWNTFEGVAPARVPNDVLVAVNKPVDVTCSGIIEIDTSLPLATVPAAGMSESTELCDVVVGARDVVQLDGPELRVFVVKSLNVLGALHIRGERAPLFLVHGEAIIGADGVLDVRARGFDIAGPGASGAFCAQRNGNDGGGREGGSGASFKGRGGRGGGGVESPEILTLDDVLRGGCSGGAGGDGAGNGGNGGKGGGAVQISSAAGVRLSGIISAVGGAGQGGRKEHAGGGGGGAGGMVHIEARSGIDLDGADSFRGRVKVGGGGGGSGATDDRDGRTGIDGGDGADFGPGDGGDGGGTDVNALDDGRGGITVQTGKGGGGGGRGRIVARELF